MAAWDDAAPIALPAPRAVARNGRARRRADASVLGGIVWIGVVATLLAGIVALNVAVLRLNLQLDRLTQQRAQLRAQNASIESDLATAAASPRIYALAQARGLVPAAPERTTYIDLRPHGGP